MLDPFTFAAAVAAAVASLVAGAPEPPPAVHSVEAVVSTDDPYVGSVSVDGGIEVGPLDGIAGDAVDGGAVYSLGWIISPYTGRLVCVTGAPCESDAAFTGPEVSSYNWVTGEVN